MPPYEITRIVRSAGFDPLAPPLREGSTYVLRATDFRGILMRVVVDAHSGAIRAVNRIVPGPWPYGPIGMMTPPYGVPPPYVMPPGYGSSDADGLGMMEEEGLEPPTPPAMRGNARPWGPPLPRPRPEELASRDAKVGSKPVETPAVKSDTPLGAAAAAAAPPATPAAPKKPPPPPPMNE